MYLPAKSLALAILGGFAGGLISEPFVRPKLASAQLAPAPSRPEARQSARELSAERFVLVDAHGTVWGEFRMNGDSPEIVLYNRNGGVGWKAGVKVLQPLAGRR